MSRFSRSVLALLALLAVPARAQNMMLLGVGAKAVSAGATLMLDGLPTALGAYSTRLMRTAYAGNAIQVTRSSDSTTQNIGFTGTNLNTSALTTFCTGTNCVVTIWYDQSGNANNAVVGDSSTQPAIYCSSIAGACTNTSGLQTWNSKAAVTYNGSVNQEYLKAPFSASPTNIRYLNMALKSTFSANDNYLFGIDPNGSGGLTMTISSSTPGQFSWANAAIASIDNSGGQAASSTTGNVVELQMNAGTGAYAFWLDKTAGTTGTYAGVFLPGQNTSLGGAQFSGTQMNGPIGDIVVYDTVSALSGSQRLQIEAAEKSYWGTP